MNDDEINDIRPEVMFKSVTFSDFKKTDVKKELMKSLYNAKLEPACYWTAELICSGHYSDLWEIIILFYTTHVHISNPKLIVYLDLRIQAFISIVQNGYRDQELRLRNHPHIRKLFCEVICVLCDARKRHGYNVVKVKQEDFDLTQMTERFLAPTIDFATAIFLDNDPKELFIVMNELAYCVTEASKNSIGACYWIEWILEFEAICKSRKETCECERRTFAQVDHKFQMNIVWLIWDIFLHESSSRNPFIQRVVRSALQVFCLQYKPACFKKRRLLLYFIVEVLTEPFSTDEDILVEKEKLATVQHNIGKIYKQIKENEHSPGTEYLYQNMKASNLEKTIEKLETMNQLGAQFVPRL